MLDGIPNEHLQIVLGTLLGNGFICGGSSKYLGFQHSLKHKEYFLRKSTYLHKYARTNAISYSKNSMFWRSKASTLWHELKKQCYKDGKKHITQEWLYPLRDIALAIWYCDSGCLMGYKLRNACLRTQSFGLDGNLLISSYFNDMGIWCKIRKSKKSYIIVFSVDGTTKFLKIVAPYVHKSLYYKLDRY